jgi:cobalt-zinc-cadmium efflux system outer membrane protein
MKRLARHLFILFAVVGGLPRASLAQQPLTWPEVREKFETNNPTLKAGRIAVEESRAEEITAFLRPNPTFTASLDQLHPWKSSNAFTDALPIASINYLFELRHKRRLRLESARQGTAIAVSELADETRGLLFALRNAFIQVLQQKAVLDLAHENLSYYDRVLQVSGDRFRAGDIARIDLDRLELQRVAFESDVETAGVNLRSAKIQLLMLLNERTPVEQFDVTGPFDFLEQIPAQEELRRIAFETRPDLRAAAQSVDRAKTSHRLAEANASTDPTVGLDLGRNPGLAPHFETYMGLSVSIPLRIFDRNQGERLRTQLDIGRNERVRDAAEALVYSDVDSAYATLASALVLLRPYKAKYLQQAVTVRDTVTFSYERGGASLLDFLQAQNDYRNVERSYLALVGSYLTAAAQVNLAVGREVIP